ncbi:MAG: DUF349 domain-containing protein [Sphingobacteriales bacterium]|nr:MAG: DUF349 domain-containing protein [Sphingobacteriales bacterium]
MTQEANNTLSAWWNDQSFTGKEQFSLNENGELALAAHGAFNERTVGTLTEENAAISFKALSDKFPEVQAKVLEVENEWNAAEDKLKLLGKVERTKEYLKHAHAVGDFKALYEKVLAIDNELNQLVQKNYDARLEIVKRAEAIADSEEWKDATQKFKEITDEWKATGQVDKEKSDELWSRLDTAKNKFFDRKRQHSEDVEKDMLQNLDLKIELVEKAEKLAASESWKETTEVFKQLMDEWKNTGKTLHDKNEELWNRFIQAKNAFYDRKKLHFESIQVEQEANQLKKEALIEHAEAMKENTDWGPATQVFTSLFEEWKKIGKVPLEKAEELWSKFNAAREHFFQTKKHHFESVKVALGDNYAQKMGLLKRAETLQHSKNWREATTEINELMDEWKKIGPVPREHSNEIWEQFISARKNFFARKDADRARRLEQAERQKEYKNKQAAGFVIKLEQELQEEQERLDDFKNGLENITPGKKEGELREHLTKLIAQTEQKIAHKQQKLDEVRTQAMGAADKNENV